MSQKRKIDFSPVASLRLFRSDHFSKAAICCVIALALLFTGTLRSESQSRPPHRDPALLDVLRRVVNTAGGAQALAAVHDITESGEVTFHWSDEVNGAIVIRLLGGNHFRMEADTADGKRTWTVKDGVGWVREADGVVRSLSYENSLNLGNLTFPVGQVSAAMRDSETDISLVGIETIAGRPVYRLRMKGQLGLHNPKTGPDASIAKDLLIDAANFDIISVEDRPFQTYESGGQVSDKPSRAIEFSDFRNVNGVRMPFLITTRLMRQKTLTIHLTNVAFNNNLGEQDFEN